MSEIQQSESVDKKPATGRLTIVEQVVHYSDTTRQPGPEHYHVETRILESGDSAYHRPWYTLKSGWNKLGTGWVENPGVIIVQVRGGEVAVGVPSANQLFELIPDKGEMRLNVHPGVSYGLVPVDGTDVQVSIKAYPR